DLPVDGRAAGARLRADIPAVAAAGRQMEDRDVRNAQRIALARRGELSRFHAGFQPELGGRRKSPHQRTAQARVVRSRRMGRAKRNPSIACMELMGFAALYPSYETSS